MRDPAPKRRWIRFSLRTLFVVVTLVACAAGWTAYQLNWIRRRHNALEHLHIGSYRSKARSAWNNAPFDYMSVLAAAREVKAPWSIRLFAETGVSSISVYGPDHATIAEDLRRLFPEAEVTCAESPSRTALERARMSRDWMLQQLRDQTAEHAPVANSPSEPVESP